MFKLFKNYIKTAQCFCCFSCDELADVSSRKQHISPFLRDDQETTTNAIIMESLHGLTKNTELEPMIKAIMMAEANGTMMYYALARLASEQGLDDIAAQLKESANQEAVHAGFYAVLNGKYPKDFWQLLKTIQKAEINGEAQVMTLAEKVRAAGFENAAAEMVIFAKQEKHHGTLIEDILKRHNPPKKDTSSRKIYVCPICGFEYEGDINSESEDWTCPLCGQPKSVFQEKIA